MRILQLSVTCCQGNKYHKSWEKDKTINRKHPEQVMINIGKTLILSCLFPQDDWKIGNFIWLIPSKTRIKNSFSQCLRKIKKNRNILILPNPSETRMFSLSRHVSRHVFWGPFLVHRIKVTPDISKSGILIRLYISHI